MDYAKAGKCIAIVGAVMVAFGVLLLLALQPVPTQGMGLGMLTAMDENLRREATRQGAGSLAALGVLVGVGGLIMKASSKK